MSRHQMILAELRSFTVDCRPDMHEPDEQGIEARVVGNKLDNAHGAYIQTDAIIGGYQELVVILQNDTGNTHRVNLADLIALARLAKLPEGEVK